jgi:hypothetical protein
MMIFKQNDPKQPKPNEPQPTNPNEGDEVQTNR